MTQFPHLSEELESLAGRVERLEAERDFLLARAGNASRVCLGDNQRWTGVSSNALVSVAFGGVDGALPSDGDDLAACYRAVMRLPAHLVSDAVLEQLARGETHVGGKYGTHVARAKAAAEWPGPDALRARSLSGESQ